jgi:integral membrane protein
VAAKWVVPLRQFYFMDKKILNRFCFIALLEGISYLLLLGIAMPLKYFADMPLAVKYTGWAHGILFVLYILFLLQSWIAYKWSFGKTALIFVASLLPFAPFFVEKRLKREADKAPATV